MGYARRGTNNHFDTPVTMEDKFEIFAIINLFGHQQLAGQVTLRTLGSVTFIQVDVPETKRAPKFTRFINPTAIYDFYPVTEDLMKRKAEALNLQPISIYDIEDVIKKLKAGLPEGQMVDDE